MVRLLQARVPSDLLDALRDQAEKNDRSIAAELRVVLRDQLQPSDAARA